MSVGKKCELTVTAMRVLEVLAKSPDREFCVRELRQLSGVSAGNVIAQAIERLVELGLAQVRTVIEGARVKRYVKVTDAGVELAKRLQLI